jgi:hypothetical protein
MQTLWFSHLSKDEQADFKEFVKNSQKVLDRLSEILYNRVNDQEVVSTEDYDSPSWAYKQADRNGYLRALREIQTLLNVSDKD